MEIKFWWVLYNKQELLPIAKSGSTCPACLASRLLTGCTFLECMAAGAPRHSPQACPCWWPPAFPSLLGELETSLSACGADGCEWREGVPHLPWCGTRSLNQLMKDNCKENKHSWYFGIRNFLNFRLVLEAVAVPGERWCLVWSPLSAPFSPPPGAHI